MISSIVSTTVPFLPSPFLNPSHILAPIPITSTTISTLMNCSWNSDHITIGTLALTDCLRLNGHDLLDLELLAVGALEDDLLRIERLCIGVCYGGEQKRGGREDGGDDEVKEGAYRDGLDELMGFASYYYVLQASESDMDLSAILFLSEGQEGAYGDGLDELMGFGSYYRVLEPNESGGKEGPS
ncbi:uncharacterized protein A4U43_C01F11260 [Asparagus officinalis]|uniref:Uncharacterized protein n=1 Tax=Asparagus officinalis TaxID=4686 RepID=A0A5P1FPB6_ASPOF|nr:uncharacterized protein A4U43_C01F11260 [Asparagus officinalis]